MSRSWYLGIVVTICLAPSVFGQAPRDGSGAPSRTATPADQIKVPDGFKVQLLHSATEGEGSWVCMTVDEKGRLYVSPQNDGEAKPPYDVKPLLRVSLKEDGTVEKIEPVPVKVGGAMGMLWAFDSLYVSGVGPEGQGIYRLFDTDKDDALDKVTLFKSIPKGHGEHGAHAIVLGPHDQMLYIANGNSTPLVEGTNVEGSPYRHWQEDFLLPRILDPVATFFDQLKVPYGAVYRVDPEGQDWKLFAGGFRNQYDIDFNADGELFTYDSDMEWDVGLPWYRPTRVLHVMSGAEFGFREGNTKWPAYYPDSLGAVVDVGLGSPTGVKFGTRSNFPDKYRRAMFALDWTYGRILAVLMDRNGASYVAKNELPSPYYLSSASSSEDVEVFLSGRGMPVNDIEFGRDGSMYVTVGGRGTQAGLYRISYVGPAVTSVRDETEDATVALRKAIEGYHGREDKSAVADCWPHLGSDDRHVRFAARLAIEGQPVGEWSAKALEESNPRVAMNALLALARRGDKSKQEPLLKALAKFPLDSLDESLKLEKLRVIQLSFIRQGRPAEAMVKVGIEKLSRQYPAKSFALNHELSQLLVWLDAPDVVGKTLELMNASTDPAEQIWYATVLREAKQWTPEQRTAYFTWFGKTAPTIKGGNSLQKFLGAIRDQAIAKLPEDEKPRIAALLKSTAPTTTASTQPAPAAERKFQREWKVADLESEFNTKLTGRNFQRGTEIFASTMCIRCHRFNNEGGGVGPDITAVASRFNRRDLLDSIIEPSKVVSEQYASFVIKTKDNKTFTGQIAEENNDHVKVIIDSLTGKTEQIGATSIAAKRLSTVSTMPSNLLDVLTKDEILDLLAYIESGGNAKSPQFQPAPANN